MFATSARAHPLGSPARRVGARASPASSPKISSPRRAHRQKCAGRGHASPTTARWTGGRAEDAPVGARRAPPAARRRVHLSAVETKEETAAASAAPSSSSSSSATATIAAPEDASLRARARRFVDEYSLEINTALNVLVVGSVGFGAVFQVVEVDADIRTGWTWYEILRNIPVDNLAAYQQAVFDHPVPVKACTSGVAYTLGDFTCQLSQGKNMSTVDLKRSLRSGLAGFLIHGPLCHYWLLWTEENLSFDGAWFATPLKVFADQTAWSLFLNSAYTTCIMSLQGMRPGRVVEEIKATWWNAISAGWKFWPFVHVLTFSPIIPQDFKLLWVDCVEVVWVTILSAAVNRDAEKALQVPLNAEAERPQSQMQEQLENEFTAEVSGVEMRFDKALLPSRDESGSFDETEGAAGCSWTETCPADFGADEEEPAQVEGAKSGPR